MKKGAAMLAVYVVGVVLLCAAMAHADDRGDAVKLVKDAVLYLNANGMEKAMDAINDPKGPFVKQNLYVFALDLNGVSLANSANPGVIGQNILDVPDATGKKFRREFMALAQKEGSGWVDYKFLNPKTKAIEDKTSYIEKAGDMVLGCGIYK